MMMMIWMIPMFPHDFSDCLQTYLFLTHYFLLWSEECEGLKEKHKDTTTQNKQIHSNLG